MTGKTVSGGVGVPGGVTTQARLACVSTGQREVGLIVIESRRRPGGGRMTSAAIVVEVVLLVIGILRRRKLRCMAGVTLRRGVRKPAAMAIQAGNSCVCAGEQESGSCMIEPARLGRRPGLGRVALGAHLREIVRNVIRIGNAGKLCCVTRITFGRGCGVATGMTTCALQSRVPAGQNKSRQVVIEADRAPGCRCVTLQTITIEAVGYVIRIADGGEVATVARIAIRRDTGITIGMTAGAIDRNMRPRESECRRRMVES
jgi:hypothetical protein